MIDRSLHIDKVWDLCVVGTGPVGMALALKFDRLGDEVLVLESGAMEVEPTAAEASRAQIVDPVRHAIPAMMQVEHIRANVQAVANSHFDSLEIAQIRQALAPTIQ